VHHFSNQADNWNNDALFFAIALTVLAAAESALGLALIARINKHKKNIRIKKM
jgi:NADH:ubiquinone oxidoreductase subunit K